MKPEATNRRTHPIHRLRAWDQRKGGWVRAPAKVARNRTFLKSVCFDVAASIFDYGIEMFNRHLLSLLGDALLLRFPN